MHKDSVFCADYDGNTCSKVVEYDGTTPKIFQMGEYLHGEGVDKVAMENTFAYRPPIRDILSLLDFY